MDTKNLFLIRAFLASLAVLITTFLVSCQYNPPGTDLCKQIEEAPVKELTDSGQNTVFEDQGTIIVYHGFGCAESNESGTEKFIKVEQSLDIPAYATNATVFLNGWHLKYLNSDHHVAGLGTLIGNIRLERRTLKWQAASILSDDNFDDAYSSCYYYTVVAWNSAALDLTVDHNDGCFTVNDSGNFFIARNEGTTTALSSFPTFLQNPNFASSKTVAILPRGYGFEWDHGDDHHLLQVAYNLDHSEIFIENGKKYKKKFEDLTPSLPDSASRADSGYVSWETYGIFKDNDGRRDYDFGEMVSGLGGNDVGIIQPPFSILPQEDTGIGTTCYPPGNGVETKEFVIDNVPYKYAIPMLTGWKLGYGCDDEHVKEIGIWIDEIHYKDPGDPVGRLRYKLSSILRDNDNQPFFTPRQKVIVLGLKPVAPGGTQSQRVPDLVPFSPLGTGPSAFCRLEQNKKFLRVSIKNQGNADAGASKTTVTFGNTPFTLDTPAIPAGGSVDLLFRVPASCFNPDCSFKITVDSSNQVDESNNEGNNNANGGCIG